MRTNETDKRRTTVGRCRWWLEVVGHDAERVAGGRRGAGDAARATMQAGGQRRGRRVDAERTNGGGRGRRGKGRDAAARWTRQRGVGTDVAADGAASRVKRQGLRRGDGDADSILLQIHRL